MGSEQVILLEEERRVQQLAAAKKKLSNFRARGSDSSQTASSFPSAQVVPLTTGLSDNCPRPTKEKEIVEGLDKAFKMDTSHRRQASGTVGTGHRRRPSSISVSHSHPAVPLRTSVTGLFESSPSSFGSGNEEADGLDLPCFIAPSPNPLMTPLATVSAPTPSRDNDPVTPKNQDDDSARAKFTSFSFGSKPFPRPGSEISTPLNTLREREANRSPNHSPRPSLSAPGSLFMNRLSTPISRPPSLLVTRPTPLQEALSSAPISQTPPSPPTPARKRHSHTRSNSISMPNLKLGRPQSYSVLSTSPSFPSSPVSPDALVPDIPQTQSQGRIVNGRKLKFEPSGRGAEAEQLRDESRRKALEKLTGQRSPTIPLPLEEPVAEISLPDMDDDEEVEASSHTSFMSSADADSSGTHALLGHPAPFGRYSPDISTDSSPISPIFTPATYTSPQLNDTSAEKWSAGNPRGEREEFLGLGIGLDTTLKRISMPSALGVLTEEDESEDYNRADISIDSETYSTGPVEKEETPIAPTPSRLRELHLVSSSVHASPSTTRSDDTSHALNRSVSDTPTKPLISTRRPRPLSGIGHTSFGAVAASPTSNSNTVTTPKSASALLRRRSAGSGSRGSSISYRKDSKDDTGGSSTGSSKEWSLGRITSPTALSGFGSPPPISSAAQYSRWPQSSEEVEELASPVQAGSRWSAFPTSSTPTATIDRGSTDRYSSSMTESSDFSWRDSRLELEMERDAFREDADLWRTRCLNAEENLKAERSETAVLRERVRKLGDRLSSVSSSRLPLSTQPTDESRPLNEMRDQLFSLMSLVEREQREKQDAISRIAELENQLHEIRFQSTANAFRPVLPSQAFGQLMPAPPSPIITPATPLPSSPAPSSPSEANGTRMKSWGFPSGRKTPTPPKEKRRESFFGLSTVLRGPSILEEHSGIDLPPISLPVSQPMARERSRESTMGAVAPSMARSNSMTSSASSVVHFFSGYLGRGKSNQYTGDESRKGVLDLRGGCSCCTGEVFEL